MPLPANRQRIPAAVISQISDIVSRRETHASLNNLFVYAGVSGEAPSGSKKEKVMAWLRQTNVDPATNPIQVFGQIIEAYMERLIDSDEEIGSSQLSDREQINNALAACGLQYV